MVIAAVPPGPRRIVIVSDAWFPQTNGVVRTLSSVRDRLRADGRAVLVVGPDIAGTVPCPRYPEIRLAIAPGRRLRQLVDGFRPEAIHIATEGPLGLAARRLCRRRGWAFTTSWHTQFPLYLRRYTGIPTGLSYAWLRRFHGAAAATLVPTRSVKQELDDRGFSNVRVWTRGVDTSLFGAVPPVELDLPRPICLYCGRVAVEKNIEAFLEADLPGSRLIVGDGPARASLERRYPGAHWVGFQYGRDLAAHYAAADVFVFPSRTDTFGVVMIEAMASGLPVAAYPVTGPIDVVRPGVSGALDEDLGVAVRRALEVDRESARRATDVFTWDRAAEIMLDTMVPVNAEADRRITGRDGRPHRPRLSAVDPGRPLADTPAADTAIPDGSINTGAAVA
jgi:glycosyltransferase involved in cell wall biosynthesis